MEEYYKIEKKEHESCKEELCEYREKYGLELKFERENQFLGLDQYKYVLSYFIGIEWLKEKESYIVVEPKIDNLDYVKMFNHCLEHQEISEYLDEIYNIDFAKPRITTDTKKVDFTPFLIAHFLTVVEKITKQGLKSNYIVTEENLKSKIKGKIVFSQQIKKNIAAKRSDRAYCRFQEYSTNCLENRLLKKALVFTQRYISKNLQNQYKILLQKSNRLLSAFENISDEISISEIKRIKINSLYKEYTKAIELAKQILRYFNYSFKKADEKQIKNRELPPFRIDMSILFELYVYSLLKNEYGKEIEYQSHGKYGYADFLKFDEKLIIDTKYKKIYDETEEEKNKYKIEDIRQLSGYARDKGILRKLKIFNENTKEINDNYVVECVIIYPTKDDKKENFENRCLKEDAITGFTKFFKCGIKLPTLTA